MIQSIQQTRAIAIEARGGAARLAVGVAILLSWAASSFAINGREAVGMCIDSTAGGARCAWNVNSKGEIDICNKSGCVYCPSAEGTCTVAAKIHKPPTHTLPSGATVETKLGTFKVKPRPITGPLLKHAPGSTAEK